MATKAHLEGNARYLGSMKSYSLRLTPDQYSAVQTAAAGSVNAYIIGLLREHIPDFPPSRSEEKTAQTSAETLTGQIDILSDTKRK